MVGGLRVIDVAREYASGSLQNLFLGIWRQEVSREAVTGFYGGLQELIRAWPGGVGMLLYVETGTVVPSPEVRDFLIDRRREVAPHLLAASLIVEGDGLWSATVRTIGVTLGLASGSQYPAMSFAKAAEAVVWQGARMGPDFSVATAQIERALGVLRAQAPERG